MHADSIQFKEIPSSLMPGLQKALEMYYADNGAYPYNNAWWGNCASFGSHDVTGANGYIPNLAPTYIPTLPLDPKPIDPSGCILYQSNGTDYFLMAYLTYEGAVPAGRKRPIVPNEQDYAIYTPGAAAW